MAAAGQATGTINGTAQSSSGQTLPNYTVRLRNLQNGELSGTTTSNATGGFTFTGLTPSNYVLEIVNGAGDIVGTSAPIVVAAGATVAVTVSAAAAAAVASGGGISTALIVTAVAAAAGVAGIVVVATRDDASPTQ